MLLNHVTGDIRTHSDGTICGTFNEAGCKWGLLEDDNENDLCLAELQTAGYP